MKRTDYITLLICLLAVGVALVVVRCPRTVPWEQCSEVYKKYSQMDGINAAYIKDYRINDTLTVAVTLLEATTDSGWAVLQEDFNVPVVPKEYEELFCGDSNKVSVEGVPKKVPLYFGEDTIYNDLIVTSRYRRTIAHFVITSREQKRLIINKHLDDKLKNEATR
ncbi:MAG: hypothetical protein IKH33_00735 [Bacteroidales bacterium]|nr:hypothetical protein [Bacteroidales bacterium]